MYAFHVYNGMMGVILLTVEMISLGSTASTYPPPGHLTMIMEGVTQQQDRAEKCVRADHYTNSSVGHCIQ